MVGMIGYRPRIYWEVENLLAPELMREVVFESQTVTALAQAKGMLAVANPDNLKQLHLISFGETLKRFSGAQILTNTGQIWVVVDQPITIPFTPVMSHEDVGREGIGRLTLWPSVDKYQSFGTDYHGLTGPVVELLRELCRLVEVTVELPQPVSLRGSFGGHGTLPPQLYLTTPTSQLA